MERTDESQFCGFLETGFLFLQTLLKGGMRLLISPKNLEEYLREILVCHGVPAIEAEMISASLVEADLKGVSSHGVARLAAYVKRLEEQKMVAIANIHLVKESGPIALFDGGNSFGQVCANAAVQKAKELTDSYGLGLVCFRNSNHFGMASFFTNQLCKNGLIGWAISNAPPAMAPFGATKPLLGTNPLSVAIPSKTQPIILDMATTVVARGKIRLAAKKGEPIPPDWALDSSGKPTTSPDEALKGSLQGIGGPKGSGLALIIEILTGVLTGGVWGNELKQVTDLSGPCGTSFLLGALDPGLFISEQQWEDGINDIIQTWRELPGIEGKSVLLPGEPEQQRLEKNREGLYLSEKLVTELNEMGKLHGVSLN